MTEGGGRVRADPSRRRSRRRPSRSTLGVVAAWAVMAAGAGAAGVIAQSPDGRTGTLVVLNKGEATATFLDVASGQIVATLPTGQGPHELAMTSDGTLAVSTDYSGGNSLTVFDVAGTRVVRTIDLGLYPAPHGAYFLPGDSVVAVTSERSRTVVLVDVRRGTVAAAISTDAGGSHMVAVTGDGSTLYTGDMQAGTVSRLDVASASKTRSYDVPPVPEAITVSPDGRHVWVGSNDRGLVSVLDTESGAITETFEDFSWPYRILIVEERDLVVIPDLGASVVRFFEYATRRELDSLPMPGDRPQGVALTHDRGTLFLSLSAAGEVAVIDLGTRAVVRRLRAGPTPDGIGWSPVVLR